MSIERVAVTGGNGRIGTASIARRAVEADLDGHESLTSVDKARDLLDWEPARSWRDL